MATVYDFATVVLDPGISIKKAQEIVRKLSTFDGVLFVDIVGLARLRQEVDFDEENCNYLPSDLCR